jgi:hypothetical protein
MYMKKILLSAPVLSLLASAVMASNGGPALTHFVSYSSTGMVYVYFDATAVTNVPACGQGRLGNTYNYVFDGTSAAGKAMLAGIIAAHAAGEGVWFSGTGDCGVVAGNETLAQFHTQT